MRHFRTAGFSALGLVLVLLLGVAAPASAATITATWTGTVASALDTTGVFGTPGADLAKADYRLVFTVDPTVGNYSTFSGPLSGDQVFGGISAVLTINGHSYAFQGVGSPGGNFDIAASAPGNALLAFQVANASIFSQVRASIANDNPPGFPTSVFTAVSLTDCPSGTCKFNGDFIIPAASPGGSSFTGALNFGSLTVAATPIPAALPLLVSALGGLGFVGWRRRRSEAA